MTQKWEDLRRRLRPAPEGRCLIGLSGGADSTALLRILLPMRDAGTVSLEAVHVNHGLRGEASDGDETFVRGLCESAGIPLHVRRVDLAGRQDENAARIRRYEAFGEVLRERGIPVLILAHQRDDQAETFLLRLLRGAGPEGLRGMRPREKREEYTIIRPMLDISGRELRNALEEDGLSWREDGTNQETRYFRNRIRLELLPLMEEMAPGAGARAARAAGLIGQDEDALSRRAEELLARCSGPRWIGTAPLQQEPEAVRSRMLRRWWELNGPTLEERNLSYGQTVRLESLLEAPCGAAVNLPAGWRARRRKDRLILLDGTEKRKNPAGEETGNRKKERS